MDPRMHSYLLERVSGSGQMPFDIFIRHALYAPELGYYSSERQRVGRNRQSDFYTASSLGKVFAELLVDACVQLLPDDAAGYTFVEIGAEPGKGVLQQVEHPFAAIQTLSLGSELQLEGKLIVFSNELFDAQPFRRFVVKEGVWRERGVRIDEHGIHECLMPEGGALPALPASAEEGYQLDAPTGSVHLLHRLAMQKWSGLFAAFDYGLSWEELIHLRPQGTARTYYQHQMGDNLLVSPGQLDITCHVCWDWLRDTLQCSGFESYELQRQEAFLMRHASGAIGRIVQGATGMSPALQTLKELLHPDNMGSKFQVLYGLRPNAPKTV
jgi:SAM-dependent MidA family methyltransferase